MRVETWQKILGKINQAILDKKNADPNFKFENIIEELKDELKQVLSKDEYKKWEDEGFNLNHLFQVEGNKGTGEYTVLDLFAGWGLENGVKALLAINDIHVNTKNQRGLASLHHAARKGHIQVVEALLAVDGIDVNIKSKNGLTPLHYAALNGHVEVVKALLAVNGIDVNIKDEINESTPLHYAAGEGYVKVVEALLAKDAKVNIKDKINGSTPLHRAIGSGRIDVVYALLAADAEVNAKDNYGNTQLGLATKVVNGKIKFHLSADEKQQWQDVVTAMEQRLEFTKKRNFAAGGATLGTAVGGAGVAAALTAVEYIPWEPKYMILTAMAIALVSLAVGYIVYHAFKEPGTKVNEIQETVTNSKEALNLGN